MNENEEKPQNLKKFYGLVIVYGEENYILLPKSEYDSLDRQGIPSLFCLEAESEQDFHFGDILEAVIDKLEADREKRYETMPMRDFYLEFYLNKFDEVEWRHISREEYDELKNCKGKFVFHEFAPTERDLEIGRIKRQVLFYALSEPIEKVESESCA